MSNLLRVLCGEGDDCKYVDLPVEKLKRTNIVLASASPRRQEILQKANIPFRTMPSSFEENLDPNEFANPQEFVIATSQKKAVEVACRFDPCCQDGPKVIIGADTAIFHNGDVLGKPLTEQHAIEMLWKLNGNVHEVVSGVTLLVNRNDQWHEVTFSDCTNVYFRDVERCAIENYVAEGESLDKAGAYGIQSKGRRLVDRIEGDYYNVVGFPLYKFSLHLLDILQSGQ